MSAVLAVSAVRYGPVIEQFYRSVRSLIRNAATIAAVPVPVIAADTVVV